MALMPSHNELIEKKKAFLSRYTLNELNIARLEAELEHWEARAEQLRLIGGDEPLAELAELRGALYDSLVDSTELRGEIARCVASVADDNLRLLMEYRYIDGLTWEKVADKLHNEYRWVMRLHLRALAQIELPAERIRSCSGRERREALTCQTGAGRI